MPGTRVCSWENRSGGPSGVATTSRVWAGTEVPMPVARFIGTVEVLGALGLVLPPLTGVAVGLAGVDQPIA